MSTESEPVLSQADLARNCAPRASPAMVINLDQEMNYQQRVYNPVLPHDHAPACGGAWRAVGRPHPSTQRMPLRTRTCTCAASRLVLALPVCLRLLALILVANTTITYIVSPQPA